MHADEQLRRDSIEAGQQCLAANAIQKVGIAGNGERPVVEPIPAVGAGSELAVSVLEGRLVTRHPEQLHVHAVLAELGWKEPKSELGDSVRLRKHSASLPIPITTSGTILAELWRWKLAVIEGETELRCIEYSLNEDESLQFILKHHQPSRGWNPFTRIRLALKLELSLRQKALDNMRAGGRYKGSASLPDLEHIDVREAVAKLAGVGARNVSKTKTILQLAHPRLIAALHEGTLTINAAMKFCSLPSPEQLERFTIDCEDRAVNRIIRQSVREPTLKRIIPNAVAVINVVLRQEAQQPGSIAIRLGRTERTVIVVGQDLLAASLAQGELKLT